MPMTSSLIHKPPETIIWTPQLPPPKARNDNCGGVVERMMYWQLLYSANNYFSKTSSLSSSFGARKTTSFGNEVYPRVHWDFRITNYLHQVCWMLVQNYVASNVKGTWLLHHNTAACTYDLISLLVVLKILFSFQRMIFLDCNKSCLNCTSQLGLQTIRLNLMQCCVSSRLLNRIISNFMFSLYELTRL